MALRVRYLNFFPLIETCVFANDLCILLQQIGVSRRSKRKLEDFTAAEKPNLKRSRKGTRNITSGHDKSDTLDLSSAAEQSFASNSSKDDDKSFTHCIADLSFESIASCGNQMSVAANTRDYLDDDIDSRRKQYKKHKWSFDSVWSSLEEATKYLNQKEFVKYKLNDKLIKGIKIHFRCKLVPKEKKVWCSRQYEIFCPNDSTEVIVKNNSMEHDHEKVDNMKKLSSSMINFLTGLFEKKTTDYDSILFHIAAARSEKNMFTNECDPSKTQVAYRLKKFRGKEAETMISLGDLMQWCNENSHFPEDQNSAFVLSSKCSALREERNFQFVVSTPYLINTFKSVEKICIDSTSELNWHGFPVTILGIVDRAKKFHPIAYACTTNEKENDYAFVFEAVKAAAQIYFSFDFKPSILIADGADAIRNAFYKSFESAKLDVMCFAHVLRNIRKRKFVSQNNRSLIIEDIRKIQLAADKQTFKMMANKFCLKWSLVEADFIAYFKKQWLGRHCNWYEGAALYTPSTNNAQEGYNGAIKKKVTLRRRLPMKEFLGSMKQMASDRSSQLFNKVRMVATEPIITKKAMQSAALLEQNSFRAFKAKKVEENNTETYIVPSSKCAVSR